MRRITTVVIHHSGTPQSLSLEKSVKSFDANHKARLHATKNSLGYHIAYHYVIGGDGRRAKTRGLDEVGFHAGDLTVNRESVGICVVGNFYTEKPSVFQIKSLKYLLEELEKKLGDLEVVFHNQVSDTMCPGPNFTRDLILPEETEGRGLVEKGIWNGERPNEPTTRLETAIMIERAMALQKLEEIQGDSVEMNWDDIPDGAVDGEDNTNYEYVTDNMSFKEMRRLFGKCKTNYIRRIAKDKSLRLTQEEFKKKSQWCTAYAHFNHAIHYGIDISRKDREKIIKRYIKNSDMGEDKGMRMIDSMKLRDVALRDTGVYPKGCKTYLFPTGHFTMRWLIAYWNHCFTGSFMKSTDFADDREDNNIIDGKVHGGRETGGHAHMYCRINTRNFLFGNSYSNRRNNHFIIPRESWNEWFNEKRSNPKRRYVRKYSALHIYQ